MFVFWGCLHPQAIDSKGPGKENEDDRQVFIDNDLYLYVSTYVCISIYIYTRILLDTVYNVCKSVTKHTCFYFRPLGARLPLQSMGSCTAGEPVLAVSLVTATWTGR